MTRAWRLASAVTVAWVVLAAFAPARAADAATTGIVAVPQVPAVAVTDGWVRAVPPVSRNSAGYLVVTNHGARDDVLLGAQVQKARVTELHEMVREGDSMAMRRRLEIPVPAGATVRLAPGGLHLMLIDLQQPLQAGERLEAVLRFRDAGEQKVMLDVRAQ